MDHALFGTHDHGPYSCNRLAPAVFHVAEHHRAVRPEPDDFAGGDIVHELDAGKCALHVLNDGDRCLCCRWPRESGENNNRGKHAFHSGNLVVWKVAINKTAIGRHYSRVSAARTARRSEAHADHGVTASAASAAAYDAGAGKDLLASARCFRPCSPRLFALRLAVRLFSARSHFSLFVLLSVAFVSAGPY